MERHLFPRTKVKVKFKRIFEGLRPSFKTVFDKTPSIFQLFVYTFGIFAFSKIFRLFWTFD